MLWQSFGPLDPDEVDKVPCNFSSTTCDLYPCSIWVIKVVKESTISFMQAVLSASLKEEEMSEGLKDGLACPDLDLTKLDSFLLGEGY